VLEMLPALAAAVSAPLAQTEKIVMIGGNGSSPGASKITKDITQIMAEMPEVLEALTGLRLEDLAKRVPGVKGSNSEPAVDADAEELR
jgi:flotillin